MKSLTTQLRLASLLSLILLACAAAYGQITPLGDSYTNSADPTTNYGAKTLVDVDGATQTTYIQFNLASIPAGASVSQATLKLFVNAVTTAGSFNVDYVNGTWSEGTLTADNAPALGTTIASGVAITTADKNQYILINVTAAVQAWLDGSQANDGIALVANSTFNATFDSKENTTTSHPAELDIAYAGGDGTITGVTTASGSGLTGGGTSGTLNLSLTNACAANQVLEYSGSAWTCASVGTGTVTSVGSGLGLTGGPITGSGTLSINTAVVPQLAAANTFTGNQTVSGNLSATGVVTGSSFSIGSNLFGYGSYANGNSFLGFAGNTTMTGTANTAVGLAALVNDTTGTNNTAVGLVALDTYTTGNYNTAVGSQALAFGNGNNNTAIGFFAGIPYDGSLNGSGNTFVGSYTSTPVGTLSNATAIGYNAVVAENNAMVLGQIKGVNGAAVSTAVGIGTTTPQANLDVAGNNVDVFIGNPQCGSDSFAGIAFGANSSGGFNNCENYSMVGDGTNTYVGAPTGTIYFRVNSNNTTAMTIASNGTVTIPSLDVTTSLSKPSGTFKIDHPLDPANKYLYHSFVESPDMMDVYNGNITTDKRGVAVVVLPEYFEALNRDFRYQLTAIGQFAQAIVARKIAHNRFVIRTNKPGVEVSWQVTGIRQDAFANAHRIQVEVDKAPEERGKYLHPELFGASAEHAIGYAAPPPSNEAARAQVASARGVTTQRK